MPRTTKTIECYVRLCQIKIYFQLYAGPLLASDLNSS